MKRLRRWWRLRQLVLRDSELLDLIVIDQNDQPHHPYLVMHGSDGSLIVEFGPIP